MSLVGGGGWVGTCSVLGQVVKSSSNQELLEREQGQAGGQEEEEEKEDTVAGFSSSPTQVLFAY